MKVLGRSFVEEEDEEEIKDRKKIRKSVAIEEEEERYALVSFVCSFKMTEGKRETGNSIQFPHVLRSPTGWVVLLVFLEFLIKLDFITIIFCFKQVYIFS